MKINEISAYIVQNFFKNAGTFSSEAKLVSNQLKGFRIKREVKQPAAFYLGLQSFHHDVRNQSHSYCLHLSFWPQAKGWKFAVILISIWNGVNGTIPRDTSSEYSLFYFGLSGVSYQCLNFKKSGICEEPHILPHSSLNLRVMAITYCL